MGKEPRDPGEERLLPGEAGSISSGDRRDFRQWVEVYRELHGFKQKLLAEVDDQAKHVTPPGGAELDNDRKLLQIEAARLQRRLEFWQHLLEKGDGRLN